MLFNLQDVQLFRKNLVFLNYIVDISPFGGFSLTLKKNNFLMLHLYSLNDLLFVIFFFKNHSAFSMKFLNDQTCVDELSLNADNRFKIVALLSSPFFKIKIAIFYFAENIKPIFSKLIFIVPSLSSFFKSSVWAEREIWDMFGIFFSNHSDLRRILSDYGFEGFPLRKDFPTIGFVELRFDEKKK